MARIVRTGLIPILPEEIGEGTLLVTLSSSLNIAPGTPSRRLNSLAADVVRGNRLSVATAAAARQLLKRTIAGEFPHEDTGALAKRLSGVLAIVLRTGIDPSKLVQFGSERVKRLGKTVIAYRNALRARNLIDAAETLHFAALSEPKRMRMVIIGHYRARKEEIEFIDSIADDGSVYYLPCGDAGFFAANRHWADHLSEKGWQIANDDAGQASPGNDIALRFAGAGGLGGQAQAFEYPDVEAEVRGTLAEVKQLIVDGADPYSIALVARDQSIYAPAIAAVADEYGLPVRIDHAVPLGSTATGGFIRDVIEAVSGDLPFETTLRLVMHGFGPKLTPEKLGEARRNRISGVERWSELLPELANMSWPERQRMDSWIADLRRLLNAFGVRQKAARRSAQLVAYNTFLDALSAIDPPEGDRDLSFEAFAAVVSDILSDESTKLRPARAGVALLEPKNIVGAAYERIFVLGMAEGVYPKPPSEDPVVDFYERKQLGANGVRFAEAAEVARWEELSFYFTLLAARGSVVLSYPKIVENGESVPSSFFQRLGIDKVPMAAERTAASSLEEQRRTLLRYANAVDDPAMDAARTQFAVESRRESSLPFDEFDGVTGVPIDPSTRTWSASQLTTIGQCSFRWYAQRLLRLAPPEEMQIGLDPSTRGLLYHKALEIAVTKAKDAPDIRSATLEHLDAAFAEAELDDDVNLPRLPNWEVERQEQLRDLRKAVAAADFIFEGSRVVGIEQKFEDVWQGFPLVGFIDRVDNTPNGLIAIDYKTSGSVPKGAKDRAGKLSVDVQIPLYANVALKSLYPEGTLGDSAYYSLTKGKILRSVKADDMEKLNMLAEDIHQILDEGSFAVDPDDAEYACTYCEFETVCRKGPRLRRKSRA
ncbi:MAG: PD-(D/E)XK nuclease family protein [Acidobacteriota bacterium]